MYDDDDDEEEEEEEKGEEEEEEEEEEACWCNLLLGETVTVFVSSFLTEHSAPPGELQESMLGSIRQKNPYHKVLVHFIFIQLEVHGLYVCMAS